MTMMIAGEVIERVAAIFRSQIVGASGLLTPGDIAYITYDIYTVPMSRSRYLEVFGSLPALRDTSLVTVTATGTPVRIVWGRELDPEDVMFDSAQLDDRWSAETGDTTGFNFEVELSGLDFPEIDLEDYPTPEWQEVWFNFVPVLGNPFSVPFMVKKAFSLANRSSGSGTGTL